MTDDVVPHTPYQGLVQIFNYNRPFYLRTAAVAIAAILLSNYLPPVLRLVILLATGIASFWICSSLVVSHYIYDRSDLCRMRWLPGCLSQAPERWMSIHAGINESSLAIGSIFSGSKGQVIDIYDPRKMTEPSIKRARHVTSLSSPAADLHCLPAPDDNFDAVFLIFTAHELRRHKDRLELFREIARVLRSGGELVLVEHVRDWANFLAFGPGFLHFFSKRTWATAANSAALRTKLHTTVTPFVHVFVLQKSL
jgi:SAM-dependent methyltransferase